MSSLILRHLGYHEYFPHYNYFFENILDMYCFSMFELPSLLLQITICLLHIHFSYRSCSISAYLTISLGQIPRQSTAGSKGKTNNSCYVSPGFPQRIELIYMVSRCMSLSVLQGWCLTSLHRCKMCSFLNIYNS